MHLRVRARQHRHYWLRARCRGREYFSIPFSEHMERRGNKESRNTPSNQHDEKCCDAGLHVEPQLALLGII